MCREQGGTIGLELSIFSPRSIGALALALAIALALEANRYQGQAALLRLHTGSGGISFGERGLDGSARMSRVVLSCKQRKVAI